VCTPGDPFTGGDPINPGLCPGVAGSPSPSDDWDELQPKVTLSWQATDRLNVFGSWGVGFKSGGFNNFGSQATVDNFINIPVVDPTGAPRVLISDQYDEETSSAFEAGFRTSIGDTIQLNGAAYYIEVDDMQFFEFFVGQFGLLRVVSNIDEVEIFGAELSGTWAPFEWLAFQANGNWNDTEINDNSSRPDTEGNDAPYTPEYTFYVSSDITWPITSNLDLIGTLSVTGTGKTWFHSVQDQQRPTIFGANGQYDVTERESFELVDLRAGVQGENWSVVAVGRNILDKNNLRESIPAPEFGGSFNAPGNQSWWGVEATYSFGQ
jgi:iron complex outermembrane receptor protein